MPAPPTVSTKAVAALALDPSQVPVLDRRAEWTLDRLLADPAIVPRHFPADRHGPPSLCIAAEEFCRGPAGVVGYLDGDTRARCPEVAINVLGSYRVVLSTLGMAVDHHGWLYSDRAKGGFPELTVAHLEPLMPRVLRCLCLLELRGYSRSGYQDGHGYSYARALAAKLVDLLPLAADKGVLAAECSTILAATWR